MSWPQYGLVPGSRRCFSGSSVQERVEEETRKSNTGCKEDADGTDSVEGSKEVTRSNKTDGGHSNGVPHGLGKESDKVLKSLLAEVHVQEQLQRARKALQDAPYISDYRELMGELEKKNPQRASRVRVIVILVGIGVAYTSFDLIKGWMSDQAAAITKQSLEDPEFQKSATEFCELVIGQLVQSDRVRSDVIKLIELGVDELMQQEQLIADIGQAVEQIIRTEAVASSCKSVSSAVVEDLFRGEQYEPMRQRIRQQLVQELERVASDPKVHAQMSTLAIGLAKSLVGL